MGAPPPLKMFITQKDMILRFYPVFVYNLLLFPFSLPLIPSMAAIIPPPPSTTVYIIYPFKGTILH